MNKLNKDETKKYIIKIFNFIENGDSKFKGHPGLYFFHTKKQIEEKIKELLNKEQYDELEIYAYGGAGGAGGYDSTNNSGSGAGGYPAAGIGGGGAGGRRWRSCLSCWRIYIWKWRK